MSVWSKARTRAGALTLLAGVLTVGGTAGVVAAVSPASDQQPAGTVYVAPTSSTPAATTGDATPAPVVTTEPVPPAPKTTDSSAPVASAATVQSVTTPERQAATIPAPQTNADGSLPEGWKPPANPGEPPVAPVPVITPEPLPGEAGYVAPTR